MQTEEFLLRVQKRGPDSSLDTTVAATIATFEALGQNLLTEEARRMTAQLPRELSGAVSVGGVEM